MHSEVSARTVWQRRRIVPPLPETSSMPCGKYFAVCQNSGTRQTSHLPWAKRKSTRQIIGTRQIFFFAVCQDKKHTANTQHTAKVYICRVLLNKAHGKEALFAVCLGYYTRQSFGTRWNYENKVDFALLIFLCYTYIVYCTPCLNLVYFSLFFIY